MLRFEKADQRAAIVEAERRRRAEIATRVSTDDAFPPESPVIMDFTFSLCFIIFL